jgi:hypothetical protein
MNDLLRIQETRNPAIASRWLIYRKGKSACATARTLAGQYCFFRQKSGERFCMVSGRASLIASLRGSVNNN